MEYHQTTHVPPFIGLDLRMMEFEQGEEDAWASTEEMDTRKAMTWHIRAGVFWRKLPDVRDVSMRSNR